MNDSMPSHTVRLAAKALGEAGKDVENSKVAVLGAAYKGETDDASSSPAEQIVGKLMNLGAEVVIYDPFCEESYGAKRAQDLLEAIEGSDCIVTVTDHKLFQRLSLRKTRTLMNERPVIVDGRRIFEPTEAKKLGFTYYGIGHVV